MASIQQAMNQMLATAGVGAGLYAHSPEGQERAHFKQLGKEEKGLRLQSDTLSEALEVAETAAEAKKVEKAIAKTEASIADVREKRFKLKPSEKALRSYEEQVQNVRDFKGSFKDRLLGLSSEEWKKFSEYKGWDRKYTIKKKEGDE